MTTLAAVAIKLASGCTNALLCESRLVDRVRVRSLLFASIRAIRGLFHILFRVEFLVELSERD